MHRFQRVCRPLPTCVCAALLALLAAVTAHAGDRKASDRDAPAAALYHNYCSVCHGDRGDGQSRARGSLNPPPRDFTTAQALAELSRPRMVLAVAEGRPGTAMVSFKSQLSPKQIETVVDYVRDAFMRPSAAADAGRGRQIYTKTCAVCHGDRGAGSMWASANLSPAPRDFSTPQAKSELSRERMLAAVTQGRPGTAMAGFATQLSADDIGAVVDYVRLAFMQVGTDVGISGTRAHGVAPAAVADMRQPLPRGLHGDTAKGREFYRRNCATCHGEKGDGNGPRAYFINPKPRNFVSADARTVLTRPAIYAAVAAGKPGTEMPAWDKVLDAQQIANVSEYLFQAFIRTPGAAGAPRTPLPAR